MKALAVQKLLLSVLNADATISSAVTAIYDAPPERPAFPFMTTGDIQSHADDTKSGLGLTHFINLNVWGKKSRVECRAVVEAAYDVLHGQTFMLPDGHRMDCYEVMQQALVEPGNQTFRAIARYRIDVHPIS